MIKVGTGWDLHRLEKDRRLILGGVEIPSETGCVAHSDGDALVHAIIDAMFGAAGLGDIGEHFPDTDPTYKDISSIVLLRAANDILREHDWEIVNIDSTVIIQRPKLSPYKQLMQQAIADALDIDVQNVGVKAKTTEHLVENAVTAQAVVLIQKF